MSWKSRKPVRLIRSAASTRWRPPSLSALSDNRRGRTEREREREREREEKKKERGEETQIFRNRNSKKILSSVTNIEKTPSVCSPRGEKEEHRA